MPTANDGQTDFAIKYSMSGASVYYGATEDLSSVGVRHQLLASQLVLAQRVRAALQCKSKRLGVSYTLANGIKIAALSANGTDANGDKEKASNVGASYSIVPGVKLNAETGKVDGANYTWVAINMSF